MIASFSQELPVNTEVHEQYESALQAVIDGDFSVAHQSMTAGMDQLDAFDETGILVDVGYARLYRVGGFLSLRQALASSDNERHIEKAGRQMDIAHEMLMPYMSKAVPRHVERPQRLRTSVSEKLMAVEENRTLAASGLATVVGQYLSGEIALPGAGRAQHKIGGAKYEWRHLKGYHDDKRALAAIGAAAEQRAAYRAFWLARHAAYRKPKTGEALAISRVLRDLRAVSK